MDIETENEDGKAVVERYKMYFERKKHLYEIAKFFLWISTTLIAVNTVSIGTKKFAGTIETNTLSQSVLSYVSIYALAFVILRILIVCMVTTSTVWNCEDTKELPRRNCSKWLCEVKSLTNCEIFCIKKLYAVIKQSLLIIACVIVVSTIPVLVHLTPLDKYLQ